MSGAKSAAVVGARDGRIESAYDPYFDRVQCAFEGTCRMRDMMRGANLPDPIFLQKASGTFQVSVTLKNDAEHSKLYVRSEAAAGLNPELYAAL